MLAGEACGNSVYQKPRTGEGGRREGEGEEKREEEVRVREAEARGAGAMHRRPIYFRTKEGSQAADNAEKQV